MYCSNCAERLPEYAAFCPSCGVEIRRENPVVPTVPAGQRVAEFQQQHEQQEQPDPFASMPQARTLTLSQRTKKLILLGMAAVAILFVVIKFTGGGGGQSTPEETVRSFMNAGIEKDAQQMVTYMLISQGDLPEGQDLNSFVDAWEKMFDQQEMTIHGYEIIDTDEQEDSATVKYKINLGVNDRMEEGTYSLTKIEGKWFILWG
jgi:hypothetical protein